MNPYFKCGIKYSKKIKASLEDNIKLDPEEGEQRIVGALVNTVINFLIPWNVGKFLG
jgi:hypothetical protein